MALENPYRIRKAEALLRRLLDNCPAPNNRCCRCCKLLEEQIEREKKEKYND